jgi:hypothetical protein
LGLGHGFGASPNGETNIEVIKEAVIMKWKSKLLSSGFPLEYEVASIVRDIGFHVDGELPYTRYGLEQPTDCSIDVLCHAYLPLGEANDFKARLIVPIECKYRVPAKEWLFMGDINEPDFSPSRPEGIRQFPCFTTYQYDARPITAFCCEQVPALKAVEINMDKGDVTDTDIKHAINQLKYSLPQIVCREIINTGNCHPVDSCPFFVLPLLVTNAPIRITHADMSISTVSNAQSLNDVSEQVDCVDLYSDHPDSFEEHCRRVFKMFLRSASQGTGLRAFDAVRDVIGDSLPGFRSAANALQSLALGYTIPLHPNMYKQFWVCNLNSLRPLLLNAVEAINLAVKDTKLLSENLRDYKLNASRRQEKKT